MLFGEIDLATSGFQSIQLVCNGLDVFTVHSIIYQTREIKEG